MVVQSQFHSPTLYEVVAESAQSRLLLGYAPRTWSGLIGTVRARARDFTTVTGCDTLSRTAPHAAATASGWVVTFTGRTQRQAQRDGEFSPLAGSELP